MNKSPNTKLACYLMIAALTAFGNELTKLSASVVSGWSWVEWAKFYVAICLPTILVWRAFIDQSLSNYTAEPKPTTTEPKPEQK
jgi:uncharacterized membrane protein (DUF485 family)